MAKPIPAFNLSRRTLIALALVALAAVGFKLERLHVTWLEREGGRLSIYDVHVEDAVQRDRDDRYHALRDALARALGVHAGDGKPSRDELAKLRSRVQLARPAGDVAAMTVAFLDGEASLTGPAMTTALQDLVVEPLPDRRTFSVRLSPARVGRLEEQVVPATAETVERRLREVRSRTIVYARGRRLFVFVPWDEVADAFDEDIRGVIERVGRLEMKLVDDEADFFGHLAQDGPLPPGVRIELENAPAGVGAGGEKRSRMVRYARIARAGGESMREARERLRAWVATLRVDPDHEIAFERRLEYDEANDSFEESGFRTHHVFEEAEIGGAEVREAYAQPPADGRDWSVVLNLMPAGAARFEALTERNVNRRFAILFDGEVESAPVIVSRIPGGHATITMGNGDPRKQEVDAKKLAIVLTAGALPASLTRAEERRVEPVPGRAALERALTAALAAALVLAAASFVADLYASMRHRADRRD